MPADFRAQLRALCSQPERPSRAAVAQVLAGVSKDDLLDFLCDAADELLALVENFPNLILDGLEQKLATDTSSKAEADALLARLRP